MYNNFINNFSSIITGSGNRNPIEGILDKFATGIAVFEVRDTIHVLYMNSHMLSTIGYTWEQFREKLNDAASIFVEEDAWQLYNEVNTKSEFSIDCKGYRPDGTIRWYQILGSQVDFVKSVYPVFLVTVIDISSYKTMEKNLIINSERYRIFEETTEAFLFEYKVKEDCMIFSTNKNGTVERRVIEKYSEFNHNSSFVHPEDRPKFTRILMEACVKPTKSSFEYRSKAISEDFAWCRTYYVSVMNEFGKIESVFGRIQNIDEEVKKRNEIANLVEKDRLTGVYNRDAFISRVEKSLSCANEERSFIFSMIDIDNFKSFNDSYGHIVGDDVITTFASKLKEAFGDGVVGRFGGDEFTVFISGISKSEFEKRFEALKNGLYCDVMGHKVDITFSVGAIRFKGSRRINYILDKADKLMYEAKSEGKNQIITRTLR